MSKKNKIIIAVVSIFFVVAIGVTIVMSIDNKPTVEMYKVVEQDPISFSGSAEANDIQEVYPDSTKGTIKQYYVKDKDEVTVGQNLFIYENETVKDTVSDLTTEYNTAYDSYKDANSQVSQLKSKVSGANQKVTNITNKMKDPAQADNLANLQMELEAAKAEVQSLEASIPEAEQGAKQLKSQYQSIGSKIDSAKAKLNYVEKAKVAGTIKLDEDAGEGATAMTGSKPVITITSKDIIIKAKVTEYDYEKIKVEDRVDIEVANSGEKMSGTITSIDTMPIDGGSEISAAAGAGQSSSSVANYNFSIKPDKPIHYGFSVSVKLPQKDIYIPEEAVEKSGGKFYVYNVVDGVATKKKVEVELEDGIYKLISGIELGEEIISNIDGIKDKDEVKVTASSDKTDVISTDSTESTTVNETTVTEETTLGN